MVNDTGPDPGTRIPGFGGWKLAAVLLSCLAVIFLRGPDAFLHPNFWAEDGRIFFGDWQRLGPASLLHPYNGYLHLAPRLIAALAGAFPLEQTVLVYLVAAQAVALWCAVTISLAAPQGGLWPPVYLAPFLAVGATEVLSSPTNLQWILAVGLIVVLLAPEAESDADGREADAAGALRLCVVRANALVFAGLAGLSGPFSLFALAAAMAIRLALRRSPGPGQYLLIAVVAGTAAAQAVAMSGTYGVGLGTVTLPKLYEASVAVLRRSMGGSVQAIVVSAAVLAGLAVGRARVWRAGLTLFALILTLSIALRFAAEPEVFPDGVSDRYYYLQGAVWLAVLFSMLAEPGYRAVRVLAGAGLVLIGVSLADGRFVRDPRLPIDDWRAVVGRAVVGRAGGGDEGGAPIQYRYPPGWGVPVRPR